MSEKTVDQYMDSLPKWKEEVTFLRQLMISSGMEECIRWGSPCYRWNNQNVVGLAAFSNYAGIWFFQGNLLDDTAGYLMNAQEGKTHGMRQWRFTSMEQIQLAPIFQYVEQAMKLAEKGVKIRVEGKLGKPCLPDYLANVIHSEEALRNGWDSLPPGKMKELILWVQEAKKSETREKRLVALIDIVRQRDIEKKKNSLFKIVD